MIYTFKSKATGDLIMLGAHGDQVLALVGREPATKGIFAASDLPSLIAKLEAAVVESGRQGGAKKAGDDDEADATNVALKARVWPLVEMMRRSLAAREPIVWGV